MGLGKGALGSVLVGELSEALVTEGFHPWTPQENGRGHGADLPAPKGSHTWQTASVGPELARGAGVLSSARPCDAAAGR